MTCASCAARIEKRLNRLDGVEATVNYATERASVAYAPAQAHARRARRDDREGRLHRDAAARASPARRPCARRPGTRLRVRLIVSAALSLPLLLLGMIPALQFDNWQWLSLQLATPVLVWCG